MIVFLVVFAVFIVVGVGALAMRNRSERGIESGIDSFRRELNALAPRGESAPKSPTRRPILSRSDAGEDSAAEETADDPTGDSPTGGVADEDGGDETSAEPDESVPEQTDRTEGVGTVDAEGSEIRTVQIGDRPPPPRPPPSVKPTGVAPPTPPSPADPKPVEDRSDDSADADDSEGATDGS